jgi:hypothetical protein
MATITLRFHNNAEYLDEHCTYQLLKGSPTALSLFFKQSVYIARLVQALECARIHVSYTR